MIKQFTGKAACAALLFSFTLATPLFAQNQARSNQGQERTGQQSMTQNRTNQQEDVRKDDIGTFTVSKTVIFGLSDQAQYNMDKAYKELADDRRKAHKCLMTASNMIELQAAAAEGQSKQDLMAAAKEVDSLARRIETHQLMNKEELKDSYSRVLLTLARHNAEVAQMGVDRGIETMAGYPMKGAVDALHAAMVYAEQDPSEEISRAMFDADRLAMQLVSSTKQTTRSEGGQREFRNTASFQEDNDTDNTRAIDEQGGRRSSTSMPDAENAREISQSLIQAIERAQGSIGRVGDGNRSSGRLDSMMNSGRQGSAMDSGTTRRSTSTSSGSGTTSTSKSETEQGQSGQQRNY